MRLFPAAVAPALLLPVVLVAYQDGPVPGVTGGFGEPTCAQCHKGKPADDRALAVAVPKTYRAGQVYRVRVTLARPGLEVGGFEISARYESGAARGKQAGALRTTDARTQVVTGTGVQYAQHTEAGSRAADGGILSWVLEWQAPARPAGTVIFHVAANASNGDYSPLGDRIYTGERISRQQAGPSR